MARLAPADDERGAVYVEFLIAFFPLFLLFLALCQLALVAAAEVVVRHAAYAAVRSAIVVLEDPPEYFDNAAPGDLSGGRAYPVKDWDKVVAKLGIRKTSVTTYQAQVAQIAGQFMPQHGARMVPIRTAAYLPLIALAPNEDQSRPGNDSVASSLASTSDSQISFALEFTKAATTVSIHDSADSDELALEPIGAKSSVTVRVAYAFHCTVPVVRGLMCSSIGRLPLTGVERQLAISQLQPLIGPSAKFKLLSASATLPNQGADYYPRGAR